MLKRATLAALAMIGMVIAAAPARADVDFGIYLGVPGPSFEYGHPHRPHFRPHGRPHRAFVPARVVARDVHRQGCDVLRIAQRGDRYVVRATCGRRGVPVRFVYSAYSGRLIDAERPGGDRHHW